MTRSVLSTKRLPPPSKRIAAVEKLHSLGFDVAVRVSPYTPEFVDLDIINGIKCNKVLVEFLRVNTWIRRWFDIDYSKYTHKHAGYSHLPLEEKIYLLGKFSDKFELSVCEDVPEHWEYWQSNINKNPLDCCNLTLDI